MYSKHKHRAGTGHSTSSDGAGAAFRAAENTAHIARLDRREPNITQAVSGIHAPLAAVCFIGVVLVATSGTAVAASDAQMKAWMQKMEQRMQAAEQDAADARRRARHAESELRRLRQKRLSSAGSSGASIDRTSQNTNTQPTGAEAQATPTQKTSASTRNYPTNANGQAKGQANQQADEQARKKIAKLEKQVEKNSRFSFSAYARSGFLTRPNGEGIAIFDQGGITPAGSSGANTGRLGIENDNYFEGAFAYAFKGPEDSKGSFHLRIANTTFNKTTYAANSSDFVARELYSEIGDLPSFDGTAFSDASFWAGLRYAPGNKSIYSLDTDYVFLSGTGGGVTDVELGPDTKANFSVMASTFDSQFLNKDPYVGRVDDGSGALKNYVHSLIFTGNFFHGPYQLMLNGLRAIDNDQGDPAIYAHRATSGFAGTLAYDATSFFGMDFRNARTRYQLQGGTGLGAEVRDIGSGFSAQTLTKHAYTIRGVTVGFANLSKKWKLAPTFMTQYSKNRYYYGDEIYFATLDLTLVRRINKNFELKFGSTYQYDHVTVPQTGGGSDTSNGNYFKFTIAPTLKLDTSGGFFKRPELRLLASYIDFSDQFTNFHIPQSSALDQLGFGNAFPAFKGTKGGAFVFGIQSEVFF